VAGNGKRKHNPYMYGQEQSDGVVVPAKLPNEGRPMPKEVVEGRASLMENTE
jgi:hypothetical protein